MADRIVEPQELSRSCNELLVLAAIGLSIGVGLSVGLGMVARSALVTLQVSFLPTALGLTAGLLGVILIASYLPARRATLIEPVVALKAE